MALDISFLHFTTKASYDAEKVRNETAGTLDFDVDIKIGVTNNTVVNVDGAAYSEPLSFKVPSDQAEEAKEIVRLVKEHYLF